MKLHQQYLLLHSRFGQLSEHEVTLSDLAELLECTHRNTLTIVKKMVAQGWIRWVSQRGRGRRSTLTLLVPADQIAAEYMMQAMNRRELQQAAEQVGAFSSSTTMQDHLNQWLLGYSGHHTEAGSHNERIDTLRLPIRQRLHALDPLYINLLAESFITSHVFDGLVQRNEHGEIVPCLSHTWDVSSDRKTWFFYLRKGITFHNGHLLTAADVVYTFERLQSTERRTLYREVSKQILSIEAVDPLTVCFKLKATHELFLPFLSTSRAAIVASQATYGQHKDGDKEPNLPNTMQQPIGTGPFKVTNWDDYLCRLEAFQMYFQGRAHLDRVDILQIPWSTPAAHVDEKQDIESPFFHLVHNPSSSESRDWTQISAGVMVRKLLTCNTQKTGPLSDPEVRARVQTCIAELYRNGMNECNEGDLGDADKMLKNAEEWTHSSQYRTFDLPIPLQITTIPQYRMDAKRLASSLDMCGFSCTVRIGTMEQFKGNLRLESDLILFSLIRDRDEELRRYDLYLTLSEHLEDSSKKSVQEILQTVVSSQISADRTADLDRIEQFLVQQSLLFHLSEKPVETAYLPSVRGLSFNNQGWVNLRHIWFP